jgi:hypothetical protein
LDRFLGVPPTLTYLPGEGEGQKIKNIPKPYITQKRSFFIIQKNPEKGICEVFIQISFSSIYFTSGSRND